MNWVIPEWPDHFLLHVCTTHANVLERLIAHSGQQFALVVQFVPAAKLVQQGADGKAVGEFVYQ